MIQFEVKNPVKFNLNWWKPTQEEWAPILLKDHQVPWRQESDPTTGRPWKSLTKPYAKLKAKRWPGQPILRASGKMQDGAEIRPWKDGFEVQASSYGVFHQFGTSKMAARPWVGLPDTSMNKLPSISWKHILSRH